MKIILHGRPCSKKNSRRNYGHVSLPSEAYERFRVLALPQLYKAKSRNFKIFTTKLLVTYHFKQKGKYDQDIDNAMGGINDLLEEVGIVANDKLIFKAVVQKEQGFEDWSTVLEIFPLDSLSARFKDLILSLFSGTLL